MIGPTYWATGITVEYREPNDPHALAWLGWVQFYDDGFADDSAAEGRIATEGMLHTRYAVEAESSEAALAAVVDVLLRDAERLGIDWQYKHIYYPGDGNDPDHVPPAGWRELLAAQCARIGWEDAYSAQEATAS